MRVVCKLHIFRLIFAFFLSFHLSVYIDYLNSYKFLTAPVAQTHAHFSGKNL